MRAPRTRSGPAGPWGLGRPARRALALALCGALCHAASAAAAETVIGFDDLPAGTDVTTQYRSGDSSRSVVFSAYGNPPNVPRAEVEAGARSSPNVARVRRCYGEFCNDTIRGEFRDAGGNGVTHAFVRVHVGGAQGSWVLTVERAGKPELTSLPVTTGAGSPVTTPITLSVTDRSITAFRLRGPGSMDDVAFDSLDPGQPPPPPDFALTRDFTGSLDPSGEVGLAPGHESVVRLKVDRFNGSGGDIGFDVSGLPQGVTAQVEPPALGGSTSGTVLVRLRAGAGAPPSTGVVTMRAVPSGPGAGPGPRSVDAVVRVIGRYDLRVTGIEINQGIQSELLPCFDAVLCRSNLSLPFRATPASTAPVPYQGVPLVKHKKTVARVFANVRVPAHPDGVDVANVDVKLYGYGAGGKPLPGSPLLADGGARTVSSGTIGVPGGGAGMPWVTFEDRADAGGSFEYTLPDAWTEQNRLTLRAQLVPPLTFIGTTDAECETAECVANNVFTLAGAPFYPTGYVSVATIAMPNPREFFTFPAPGAALGLTELWWPLADGELYYDRRFHDAVVPFNYADKDEALSTIEDYADEHDGGCARGNLCADIVLGLFSPSVDGGGVSNSSFPGQTVMNLTRTPSIAHELSHNLGRPHSGPDCPTAGEDWPPDQQGKIQGIGLDTRARSGGRYPVIAPGGLGAAGRLDRFYDYMSYCHQDGDGKPGLPGDADRWTSVRGQYANVALLQLVGATNCRIPRGGPWLDPFLALLARSCPKGLRAPAAAIAGPPAPRLRVQARAADSGAVTIDRVKPIAGRPQAPPAQSPFQLLVRGAGGNVVSQVAMTARRGDTPVTFLSAEADAPGATSVEIVGAAGVLARRARSAAIPRVRVLAPRAGARIGGGRRATVRWRGTDADGGALTAKVDYSANDGRSWRTVYTGPSTGRATVPGTLFAGSDRGRLRVRVSDGFSEGAAVSGRLRAAGRPPAVSISSPARGRRVRADAAVYLSASAYDDASARLTGGALRWFAGRRLLGRGPRVSATGLPPGRRRLRVVARDRRGREGSASVVVRVARVTPQFLRLGRPARVARNARRVVLRVTSSVPATLRAGGRRHPVSRRPRRVAVRVRPGAGRLSLPLRLSAYGRSRSVVLRIPRG